MVAKCYLCKFSRWILDGSLVGTWTLTTPPKATRRRGELYLGGWSVFKVEDDRSSEDAELMWCVRHHIRVETYRTCGDFGNFSPKDIAGRSRARLAGKRYKPKIAKPKNWRARVVPISGEEIRTRQAIEAV